MSDFRQALQHHLNQTRAGLYGQFEHAFNFNTGPEQNDLLKIAPGESITFTGLLTSGLECSLIATNNLASSSGAGYAAQRLPANDRTIVIPVAPQDGNATLEFSCPTTDPTGPGEVVSHTVVSRFDNDDFFEAIDETLTRIFSKFSPGSRDIVSSQAGDYYCAGGRIPVGDGLGETAVFDENGTFKWRVQIQDVPTLSIAVEYDEGSEVLGNIQIEDSGRGTVKLVGYDASLNVDQGGVSEPAALYETAVVRNLFTAFYDVKVNNGSFIVAARRNNEWDGAASAFADIFKIDAVSGAIVETFDKNSGGFTFTKLAVCPVTGNIAVAQTQTTTPSGESPMNVMILDSDLNFLYSDLVPWTSITGQSNNGRFVFPTFDSTGRLFLMSQTGFMVRWTDGTLAVRDLEVNLFAPRVLTAQSAGPIGDLGHNLNGNLIFSAGGPEFSLTSRIFHYTNDGVEVSDYIVVDEGDLPGAVHVRPTSGSGPGPDLGGFFTQELSMTPPGRRNSVAAVKYADGNITGIFFNSVNVEFVHDSWKAVHSVNGPVEIMNNAPGWEYNSPL